MAFSKRLKKIASLVDSGANVIDIGCDHGLLDIYLTLKNNNKCIASDINEKSINSAKENIKKYNVNVDLVVSDGFNNINVNENSTCIIAGMGTHTIIDILKNDKTKSIDTFIIQTNNDYELLRKTLIKMNYHIDDEIVIYDKKIWYIIIKFKKGKKYYSKKHLQLGPILLTKTDTDTINFYKKTYNENIKLLNYIPKKYFIKRFKIKSINKIIKQKI